MKVHDKTVWEGFVNEANTSLNKVENHVEMFFRHVNNPYGNIKFTMEVKNNSELIFLDT